MPQKLAKKPIHLGKNATAIKEPEFTGEMQWYVDYSARHAADGVEGRLVTLHTFEASWDTWEMHPNGSEVVICTNGEITIIQEKNNRITSMTLREGEYAINEPGVWHTADIKHKTSVVFITAGLGTEIKKRA